MLNDSSSQDSLDSQYEEVVTRRSHRSLSADQSFDEDDDSLYSSISEPSGKGLVRPQGPGEYSLVGAATMPRAARSDGDPGMYELVGSRPPSKSAPPTYEMVHSPKKSMPENGEGFYDLFQGTEAQQQTSPKLGEDVNSVQEQGSAPQMRTDADEMQEQASDVSALYSSVPRISRKQKPSTRGLSMISEGENEEVDADADAVSPVPTPEEKAPPLPSKAPLGDAFAIYEIKRFLGETAEEEGENALNEEKTNGTDEAEDEPFPVRSGSAFEQLKAFLMKLDSTETE